MTNFDGNIWVQCINVYWYLDPSELVQEEWDYCFMTDLNSVLVLLHTHVFLTLIVDVMPCAGPAELVDDVTGGLKLL